MRKLRTRWADFTRTQKATSSMGLGGCGPSCSEPMMDRRDGERIVGVAVAFEAGVDVNFRAL